MRRTRAGRCGEHWVLAALLGLAALSLTRTSRAVTPHPVVIDVTREPESGGCPDATAVLAAAERLFPSVTLLRAEGVSDETIGVSVEVRPAAAGHSATLRVSGARFGERSLLDKDPECRGLGDALAVALVLIVDPSAVPDAGNDGQDRVESRQMKASRPPPPRSKVQSVRPAPPSSRPFDLTLGFDVGALGSAGLLANPAAGGFAGAEAALDSGPAFRARVLRLMADRTVVDPGTITVDLWAAHFGPCWRFRRTHGLTVSPCLDLSVGRQRGTGHDFLRLTTPAVTRQFWALGPSLTLTRSLFAGLYATLTGGVSANLWRQTYTVDARPEDAQPAAGALVALGLGMGLRPGGEVR